MLRPEPEGAMNYPVGQYSALPQNDSSLDEDETTGLLEDEMALVDVGLQPSMTLMAPDSLLPADEDSLERQPPTDVAQEDLIALSPSETSAAGDQLSYDVPATPDVVLRASSMRVVSKDSSRRRRSAAEDSYAGTGRQRSYPLTTAAIARAQQNWLRRQEMATSADDDDRSPGDVGDQQRFGAVGRSESSAQSIATLTPGGTSTSSLLFDTTSSDSDADVVRARTLGAIARMKRERRRKASPEPAILEQQEKTTSRRTSVRARSRRSQTPGSVSGLNGTAVTPSSPALVDVPARPDEPLPTVPPPAPPPDMNAETQLETVNAPLVRASAPAAQALPDIPVLPDKQPTPITQSADQSDTVPVDGVKDVQKTELVDAEGRKTTVYKSTPKAPMWQAFAAPGLRSTSLDHAASGDRALPLPAANIKLVGESKDAPASAGAGFTGIGKFTNTDQQTISRLKTLADHRGENMSHSVLKEIQGTSAKPQVRSTGLAQVTALREPIVKTPGEDLCVSSQAKLWSSAQSRLTYAPVRAEESQAAAAEYSQPELDGPFTLDAFNSLSNIPDVSGGRFHVELPQRLDFGISVPDATNDVNMVASQFLQDRFDSEKKCFRGLSEEYLSGVQYADLLPETRSLLNRISNVGKTREEVGQASVLQNIRSSLSLTSDQRLSEARPDRPQQPSSSKLAQASRRLSFLPLDAAQPDESLRPSVTKLAQKQTAEDISKPDEFLHPSLHRMTLTPNVIPARPDDALHSSETKLMSAAGHIANYDEAQNPSLTRLQSRASSQTSQVPAKLDNYLHPSLTRIQQKFVDSGRLRTELETITDIPARPDDALHSSETKLINAASHTARYDDALHPSLTRLQTKSISHTPQIPAKSDDYLHPSLTRVQRLKKAFESGQLRTDLEETTTTTTVTDREYVLYDVPARSDDILHPSSTRIDNTARSEFTTDTARKELPPAVPARPDDIIHPSSARFNTTDQTERARTSAATKQDDFARPSSTSVRGRDRALRSKLADAATSVSSFDRTERLPLVPARTDDILHPSSSRFPARVGTRGSATSAVAVDRKDTSSSIHSRLDDASMRARSVHFPTHDSGETRATLDNATSTTTLDRYETVPATPDDIQHPSSTQIAAHKSMFRQHDSASATALGRKYSVQSVSARPSDVIPFSSLGSAEATLDSATAVPARTQFPSRDSVQSTTASLSKKGTVSSATAGPDSVMRPSSTDFLPRESARVAGSAFDATVSSTPLPRISAASEDTRRPYTTQMSLHDTTRSSFDTGISATAPDWKETRPSVRPDDTQDPPYETGQATATSVTAVGGKELFSPVPARLDDILHPSSTQFPLGHRAQTTLDRATSTSAFGSRGALSSVPAVPDDLRHPPSTELPPRQSARGTMDAATSAMTLGWKETSEVEDLPPAVTSRPDDILHRSSTQFPSRGTARTKLDSTTSTTALRREETKPPVPAVPDDLRHPSSTQLPQRESVRGTADATTPAMTLSGKETSEVEDLPAVTERPDDMLDPNTQFPSRGTARTTLDSATSSTAVRSEETKPLIPEVPDDLRHPSSTQLPRRHSARGTVDAAISALSLDGKKTSEAEVAPAVTARPDDVLHPSSTQFLSRGTERTTLDTQDTATSTTALRREATKPSVPAVPDDLRHPSSTQLPRRHSARGTADAATSAMTVGRKDSDMTVGGKETLSEVAARPDDILHPSSTEFSAGHRARGTSDRTATPVSRHDDRQTPQSAERTKYFAPSADELEAARSSLRRPSDLQPSDDKHKPSSLTAPEASYPSEFLHPSRTAVGKDRAVSDDGERPSSVRVTDPDKSGPASVGDSRSVVDNGRLNDVRSTATDESWLSDRLLDEIRSGPTGLRRSSMKSVSAQPQTVPSDAETTTGTPRKVDWNRLRRTVTWDLTPRARSDLDAQPDYSVSSSGQRSLPNILGSRASTSATRTQSALTTDGLYGRASSEWSEEPQANAVVARDSRLVTREHIAKKKQQEEQEAARSDDCSRMTDEERVCRRDSIAAAAAAAAEDERARGRCTRTPSYQSSCERAGATGAEVAAADDAARPQCQFDWDEQSSSSSACCVHRVDHSEESLLECPRASVSRPPPCSCLQLASSTSSSTDTCSHLCTCIGEHEPRAGQRCKIVFTFFIDTVRRVCV